MHHLIHLTETVTETVSESAAQAPAQSDTMLQLFSVALLVMMLGCGIYCIYTHIRLRMQCYLFPNKFLYPGNCKPEECLDVDGFIDFILPRILLLGIAFVLVGIGYGLTEFILQVQGLGYNIATVAVPIVCFGWYIWVQNRAAKRFW